MALAQRAPNVDTFVRAIDQLSDVISKSEKDFKEKEAELKNLFAFNARMKGVEAGIVGLCRINNVTTEEDRNQPGQLLLNVTIGEIILQIVLKINSNVIDIRGVPSCLEEDWIDKILVEANLLQSPNDVRYIVGSIISAQDSFYVLQHELVELRKRCLVQINPQKSRELRLVFRTQHVALVLLHNAYPNVPGGLKVLALFTADDKEETKEMLLVKNKCNNQCFTSLSILFHYLEKIFLSL